jgi:hypothetical protein
MPPALFVHGSREEGDVIGSNDVWMLRMMEAERRLRVERVRRERESQRRRPGRRRERAGRRPKVHG